MRGMCEYTIGYLPILLPLMNARIISSLVGLNGASLSGLILHTSDTGIFLILELSRAVEFNFGR